MKHFLTQILSELEKFEDEQIQFTKTSKDRVLSNSEIRFRVF